MIKRKTIDVYFDVGSLAGSGELTPAPGQTAIQMRVTGTRHPEGYPHSLSVADRYSGTPGNSRIGA